MKTYRLLVFSSFILLAFVTGDNKGKYSIPAAGVSIYSCDIDLDGDIDIQTGHFYASQTQWGGGAFLMNNGTGNYELNDSIYFDYGYAPIFGAKIDENEYVDIIGRHQYSNPHKENIAIIYNYGLSEFDSIKIFNLYNNYVVIDDYAVGDIDNDGDIDIVFTCNNDFFWGIIYNDGTGNFSTPEYYDLSFPPVDIACGDITNDGRADVVVCGSDTEIYISTETGFQQLVLTTTLSHDVLISDFDNDGDNDVITHTTFIYPNYRVYMFENLGNNQFFEHDFFQFSPFCSYAQIADFNNDSLPDMAFIKDSGDGVIIYYNKGSFQLEYNQTIYVDSLTYWGLNCNDYDNNGYVDFSVTTGVGSLDYFLEIFYNDGNGNFLDNPITNIPALSAGKENPIQIFPNPFKNKTTIVININKNNYTKLDIYDLQGKLIKTFIDKSITSGVNEYIWKGKDLNGKEVQQGIYLVRLESDRKVYTQRVVFVK